MTDDIDAATITLGEVAAAERASGLDFTDLLARRASRLIFALWLVEWRRSGKPPSWQEIADRPLAVVRSSVSPPSQDGRSPRSRRSRSATPSTSSSD
jgi:hypothetical protein